MKAFIIILCLGGAVVFIVIFGALRVQAQRARTPNDILQETVLFGDGVADEFLDEFNQFDWFAIVLDITPSTMPFQRGKSFLQVFSQLVPRALWPDKPLPVSFTINTLVGGPGSGTPSTIVGELFLNFGVPGIIGGMFVFGVSTRALYAYLKKNWGNIAAVLLYSYTFVSLPEFFTRSFAPKMVNYLLFILPAVVALRLVSQKKGTHSYAAWN